ncbi:unnamed protein product, partial [Polarella glacialis]
MASDTAAVEGLPLAFCCSTPSGLNLAVAEHPGVSRQPPLAALLVSHATGVCKEAYEPLIIALREKALILQGRAITFDFRGHGRSDRPSAAMLTEQAAEPDVIW